LRLYDWAGTEVASNDDTCGLCSSLRYEYYDWWAYYNDKYYGGGSGEGCHYFTLRQGCFGDGSCGGRPLMEVDCYHDAGTGSCGSSPALLSSLSGSSDSSVEVVSTTRRYFDRDMSARLSYGSHSYMLETLDRDKWGSLRNAMKGVGRYGADAWDDW
jgi:hypothetical protein